MIVFDYIWPDFGEMVEGGPQAVLWVGLFGFKAYSSLQAI